MHYFNYSLFKNKIYLKYNEAQVDKKNKIYQEVL